MLEPLAPLRHMPQSGVLPHQTAQQGCEYGAQEICGHEFVGNELILKYSSKFLPVLLNLYIYLS
jgi:hypothetical protein